MKPACVCDRCQQRRRRAEAWRMTALLNLLALVIIALSLRAAFLLFGIDP